MTLQALVFQTKAIGKCAFWPWSHSRDGIRFLGGCPAHWLIACLHYMKLATSSMEKYIV